MAKKINILDGTKAYVELRKKVINEGILERSYRFYFLVIFLTSAGFFFSIYKIFVTPISFELLFWCLVMGFTTVQIGGIMHDASHKAIAKSVKMNDALGIVFGALIAIDYHSWTSSHDKHHAHTNEAGIDPNLDLPLHGFTKRQFANQKGLWRLLRKYQVYAYYPLRTSTLEFLRADSLIYFIKEKDIGKFWEMSIWVISMCVWFLLPFFIFSLPKAIFILIMVYIASGFYFSNIFAPNHKGMPELPKNAKISFLEHQIMTSRNIYGHWLTDYVFMSLNYQIEHHLFPNCPRNKLKLITPFVLGVCRKMNLKYTQVSIVESNRIILSTLKQVAESDIKKKA